MAGDHPDAIADLHLRCGQPHRPGFLEGQSVGAPGGSVGGLHRTALAYCVAMAAFVAVAAGSLMLPRRGPATSPEH